MQEKILKSIETSVAGLIIDINMIHNEDMILNWWGMKIIFIN